jgi:long-chain acyl-CoA synthetase
MEGIRAEDLFTLIYTSGTTGTPKGVMLTHANMMSQIPAIPIQLTYTDRVLSILPIWHIFERVFEVFTIASGVCTYYTSIRTLAEDFKNVEPTFMGSAPRLWENLHDRILKNVRDAHPMRQLLFHTAYFLSRQYKSSLYFMKDYVLKTTPASRLRWAALVPLHALRWTLVMPLYGFFNVAVLEQIRLSAGGSLKATISGGGALPAEIDRFFNYIGIPVLEGYGMTETSPVISVRTEQQPIPGTVGPLVSQTEVRIVDPESGQQLYPDETRPDGGRGRRGEIQVKGPQVMKGYYKQPELTARTIEDGWMKTGDLGMITFNDCLKIMGRSKSTIVLLSGENLEPAPIEMRLTQSRYIDQCMLVGQDRKNVAAMIVPDPEEFRRDGFDAERLDELCRDAGVKTIIEKEIKTLISVNAGFKPYELIRAFRLLPEPFKKGEELTSLFKIRRHVVQEKYAGLIEEMYDNTTREHRS